MCSSFGSCDAGSRYSKEGVTQKALLEGNAKELESLRARLQSIESSHKQQLASVQSKLDAAVKEAKEHKVCISPPMRWRAAPLTVPQSGDRGRGEKQISPVRGEVQNCQ